MVVWLESLRYQPPTKADTRKGFTMTKPTFIYKAISEAIDAFGARHQLTRGHIADAMGLHGKNAAIQLSNILNYKTYNPKTPKPMKLRQLAIILDEIDQEDVAHILNGMGEPYGLMVVEKSMDVAYHHCFHKAVDDVMLECDDEFNITKLSLKDQTLTEDELMSIIKEIEESESANAKLKAMARQRLGEMGNDNE